jgi:hypothetical protein
MPPARLPVSFVNGFEPAFSEGKQMFFQLLPVAFWKSEHYS